MRVARTELFLGVDGGGTRCRARLGDGAGRVLGEAVAGPANLRLGLQQSVAAVLQAAGECAALAGLSAADFRDIDACLALAGATEPLTLAAGRAQPWPFRRTAITSDARAACVGAHRGRDGAIVVIGTGSVGWAIIGGRDYRVGGWGLPASDEGSGAWLGIEALRRVLWAHDRRVGWTPLLRRLFEEFDGDPHHIVRWAAAAKPADLARLAPAVVEHAGHDDPVASALMSGAARHVEALAARLWAAGAARLSLTGGLALCVEPWLDAATRERLVPPQEDALGGALMLARAGALSAVEAL